jgi:beta-lactam-binding protein with PASTA domain
MTVKTGIVLALLLLVVGGCRDPQEHRRPLTGGLPDVVGLSLEDAKETLEDAGVYYEVRAPEGQHPVIDHLWEVCEQHPLPGTDAIEVELDVDREC